MKEKKHFIIFQKEDPVRPLKTEVWTVRNKASRFILGEIKWFARWRQYCFFPDSDTIFSTGCLMEINNFIKDKMEDRKHGKSKI